MGKKTSGLAVTAFIFSLTGYFCLPLLPVAILLGLIALKRFRGPAKERLKGRWLAVTGVIVGSVNTLALGIGILWLVVEWPHIQCNRNLVNIAKAMKEYDGQHGSIQEGGPGALDKLVKAGLIDESQTRCPAAEEGGRYVVLSSRRRQETGIVVHDADRYHGNERGVAHRATEIHSSPTRYSSTGDGGMRYEYQYVVLWMADPMPEDRFQKIMDQRFPRRKHR